MTKASLDPDAPCLDENFDDRLMRAVTVWQARIAAANKIDETTLAAALQRHRQGRDIGPQLEILARNYRLRKAAFERLVGFGF